MPTARADLPLHLKFGYAAVMEKRAIRERLLAAGVTEPITLHFAIVREYEKAHANDLSFREKCDRRAAQRPATVVTAFTAEELRRLIEHFADANDPIAIAIGVKAQQMLALTAITPDAPA